VNKKEYRKQYYKEHREGMLASMKQYRKEHRDEKLARDKQWRETHRDECKTYSKLYYQKNRDYFKQYSQQHRNEISAYSKLYRKQNKDRYRQLTKAWKKNHREQNREIVRRKNFKRRSLGFIPLNEPFENSEAHHIDKDRVIYIPKEYHRSVSHNVWTGENMALINNLAYDYLLETKVLEAQGGAK